MMRYKVYLILFIITLFTSQLFSQFCIDTLKNEFKLNHIQPSIKFKNYSDAFFSFIKKENTFINIDSSCKGTEKVRLIIEKLDKGLECSNFSSNIKVFSIDNYSTHGDMDINFGILEIVYRSTAESKKACNKFASKKYFKHYDKILRIYKPILYKNRLIIFHTATPESEFLKKFFYSIGIKDFILET